MMATAAPFIAVMDADLQHDETLLPQMLAKVRDENFDIAVGSRYCAGGSIGEWNSTRARMSRLATHLARSVMSVPLSDPMSGFFLVRRAVVYRAVRRVSGEGYKILLDLFTSSPMPLKFTEMPYTFRERTVGASKVDSVVLWEYGLLIIDKLCRKAIPARFVLFCIVGATGLVVHFAALTSAYKWFGISFAVSQTSATLLAMTWNYVFNNRLTYRDSRRRGWRFLTGLLSFYVVCGLGVVGNVGIANVVFRENYNWWLAGSAGAFVGTVWNYAVSSMFTWQKR